MFDQFSEQPQDFADDFAPMAEESTTAGPEVGEQQQETVDGQQQETAGAETESGASEATWTGVLLGSHQLKQGDEGPAVTAMQERLTKAGFGVQATGVFGQTTKETVIKFQEAYKIQTTGEMGAQTANGLEEVVDWKEVEAGNLILRVGDSRPAVTMLQRLLTLAGFGVQLTGVYGPTTEGLVKGFQEQANLGTPDGLVGPKTAEALEQALRGGAPGGGEQAAYNGGANWLGTFKITHYTYALESDPIHANSPKVRAPGLNPNERYRASFLANQYGVGMQGTGLAENGKYIMWDGPGRFKYGVGGAFERIERPYQQIAIDRNVIRPRSKVVVEPYRDKGVMSADDVGGGIRGRHIDVFAGPIPISEAYALGTKTGRVGYPTEEPAPAPTQDQTDEEQPVALSAADRPWLRNKDEGGAAAVEDLPTTDTPTTDTPTTDAPTTDTPAIDTPSSEQLEQEPEVQAEWQAVLDGQAALRKGDEGPGVEILQQKLADAGYNIEVDGKFGNGTKGIVARFQASHGLENDGVAGKNTARALDEANAWQAVVDGDVVLQEGSRGPAVTCLQKKLTKAGFGVQATGEFGSTTKEVVGRFQESNEVQQTFKVGATTAEALEEALNAGGNGAAPGSEDAKYEYYKNAIINIAGGSFDTGVNQMNIMGVRGWMNGQRVENPKNAWNDTIILLWVDNDGMKHCREFKATTDPGSFQAYYNPNGDANLMDGQYTYQMGYHKGYRALNQGQAVNVWRDRNKDGTRQGGEIDQTGWYGINIHAGGTGSRVGEWSAGCQVLWGGRGQGSPWQQFMEEVSKDPSGKFNYTLIDGSRMP